MQDSSGYLAIFQYFWRIGPCDLNCWNYWHTLLSSVAPGVILRLSFVVRIIWLSLSLTFFSSSLYSLHLSFPPSLSLSPSLWVCLEVYQLYWYEKGCWDCPPPDPWKPELFLHSAYLFNRNTVGYRIRTNKMSFRFLFHSVWTWSLFE